ncbi:hypothetical protein FOCC_FOCC000021, partial [Frankliniella occidentalis]
TGARTKDRQARQARRVSRDPARQAERYRTENRKAVVWAPRGQRSSEEDDGQPGPTRPHVRPRRPSQQLLQCGRSEEGGQTLSLTGWTHEATSGFQFRVFIHRCSSAAKASCEYFTTWSWDIGVCELVSANGTAWSPIVQSISPKFHCPVRS